MNIELKELSKTDLTEINKWRNDHEVIDLLGNNFLYIAKEVDEIWYEDYLQNREKNRRLSIYDIETNLIIGTVQLTSIHVINRTGEYSIMIGNKAYWGKGIGFIASKQILHYGFEDLNLNRIYLTVLNNNERAIRLYQKLGFVTEGVQKQAVYKNGCFYDLVNMAILKDAYVK